MTNTTEHENGPKFIPADPELFDEIQFKPINKGLGFHHDAKKASGVPSYSSASRIKRPLERQTRPMHSVRPENSRQELGPSISKSELGALYGTTSTIAQAESAYAESPATAASVSAPVAAPVWKQLSAWAVDVGIIAFSQWAVMTVLFTAAGLGWAKVIAAIGAQDVLMMNGLLFCFVYLMYFTVLELGPTPGKTVMKLSLRRTDGQDPGAKNTALRALVSLLSLPLLGLPLLMDFQGKLSETVVTEAPVMGRFDKFRGKRIVFTNGCFDILHRGHVAYLQEARALGDVLIVGLNSDKSVKRLKGPERPINSEQDRKFVLEGLRCVDHVEIFEEDTPLELIKQVCPDVLVKGGDWKPSQIVGSEFVLGRGGEVRSLNFVDGHSTTKTIEEIRKRET